MKLTALYKHPENLGVFEDKYFNTHLPLINKVPGLTKVVITRFSRNLMGEDYFMMADMYFTDESSLRSGLKSAEMAAAGENLNSFAEGLVTLLIGQEQEEPIRSS